MAEPDEKPTLTGEHAPSGSDSPIDPREVEALRSFAQQYGPIIEEIYPHLDDVRKFAKDEKYRDVANQAYKAFEAASQSQEPEVPEYVKELKAGQEKLVSYVDDLKNQQAIASASQQIQTLAQQFPALGENNFALVNELQAEAKEIGIDTLDRFVNYLRKNAPRYFAQASQPEPTQPKAPPRSSRPDGGLPGVPEPRKPVFDGKTPRERNQQRKIYMRQQLEKAVGGGR